MAASIPSDNYERGGRGNMCDAEHCYNSRPHKLGTAQRLFLESAKEKRRYLSDQKVTLYSPEHAPKTAAVFEPTAK